ncbi:MAG: glutaredoxin family protein [Vicinamibacteria bacterium]
MSPAPELTLLSAPGCHLCHDMAAVVRRVLAGSGVPLHERDINADPELLALYRSEIPVLLAGEREVLRHHASEDELRRRLTALGVLADATSGAG